MRKLIFLITLLFASCGVEQRVEKKVEGEVFVVTRAAGAYKFSSVEVIAVPKETLLNLGASYLDIKVPVSNVLLRLVDVLEEEPAVLLSYGKVYSIRKGNTN